MHKLWHTKTMTTCTPLKGPNTARPLDTFWLKSVPSALIRAANAHPFLGVGARVKTSVKIGLGSARVGAPRTTECEPSAKRASCQSFLFDKAAIRPTPRSALGRKRFLPLERTDSTHLSLPLQRKDWSGLFDVNVPTSHGVCYPCEVLAHNVNHNWNASHFPCWWQGLLDFDTVHTKHVVELYAGRLKCIEIEAPVIKMGSATAAVLGCALNFSRIWIELTLHMSLCEASFIM